MCAKLLSCVEIEPSKQAQAAVVWLHGLGADGHDFEPVASQLKLPAGLAVRFLFPHAPIRPVTVNGGMAMRAWYDSYGPDQGGRMDLEGMAEAETQVHALLHREHERGLAYGKVVLAGFSQGGAIALRSAASFPHQLAGIMLLSSPLPEVDKVLARLVEGPNRTTPIFVGHGHREWALPEAVKEKIQERLTEIGCRIDWRGYPMGHGVCAEEIRDISRWLVGILGS